VGETLHFDRETRYERVTRHFGIFVLAPLLLLAALPSAVHIAQNPYLGMGVHQRLIASVHADGPAERAGAQRGDLILAIDGEPIDGMRDWFRAKAGDYSLHPRVLIVHRDGLDLIFTIQPTKPPRARMIWGYSLWLAGLFFLLMGWWVLAVRRDPVARNFFAFSWIFAVFVLDIPDLRSTPYLTGKEIVTDILQVLLPVFFLRFLLLFPSVGPRSRENRRQLRLILVPPLPLLVLLAFVHLTGTARTSPRLVSAVEVGAMVLLVSYFVAGLVVFARKVLHRERRIQYTKLRVVLLGLFLGLTPFLVALLFGNLAPTSGFSHWEYLGFSLLLVPASFGLGIMRYGALDTAFVVRSSLIYGILTLVVLLGYFLVVGIVGHALTRTFQVSTWPLVIVIVAATSLAVLPLRRAAQRWVDRAFYPARLANRAAIAQLGDDLTGIIDHAEAVDVFLHGLNILYRPRLLSLFLADEEEPLLREVASRRDGDPRPTGRRLDKTSDLARYLDHVRHPVFREELEDLLQAGSSQDESRVLLAELACELLLPLVSGNRLMGFLALGAKAGGALYTQEDLANLRALGMQVASLLESRRLYRESLARKQLEIELKVARDIQAQLLPTEPLEHPGVTVWGHHEPCRAVGGDYFDFFEVAPGRIGFCIADVAGKGIPAALLMSTVRVSFRTESADRLDPDNVIARLNRAVSELLAPGQFVCFFYGIYATQDGLLTYCNAGMDPPLLLRRRGVVERLKKGGPVLGILPTHDYRRGTVRLENGDLLLLYTDGITDQRNPAGEFYDPERLIATLLDDNGAPPAEAPLGDLIGTVFASVSAFGGDDRSDDRTVMLLRPNQL